MIFLDIRYKILDDQMNLKLGFYYIYKSTQCHIPDYLYLNQHCLKYQKFCTLIKCKKKIKCVTATQNKEK
jgi:hypothetical protein